MSRFQACRSWASARTRSRCSPTRRSPTRRPSATRATSTPPPTAGFTSKPSIGERNDHRRRELREKDVSPGARRAPNSVESTMTIDVAKSVRKMFVDGNWIESESGQLFDATSPATGEVIARVSKGTREDAKRAVEAAHKARSSMAQLKGFERSKRLHRIADALAARRDELGHLLTLDQGKPLFAEALGEVDEAAEYFRIAAEDLKRLEGRVLPSASPSKLVLARHYPRGVYGVMTPGDM